MVLVLGGAIVFLLSRLEVSVDPDTLRQPLVRALEASEDLDEVCLGAGSVRGRLRLLSITAQRPFVGSEGNGTSVVVVPTDPPCRARVEFWLGHDSGPRRDATDRGTTNVRVTRVSALDP